MTPVADWTAEECLKRWMELAEKGTMQRGPIRGYVRIGRWDAEEVMFWTRKLLTGDGLQP